MGGEGEGWNVDEPIHEWFGLSYRNFLVLHRSVLQSMPRDWQRRFVKLIEQIPETLEIPPDPPGGYRLNARDGRGKFMRDPVPHYNRGRTQIPRKQP